MIVVSSNSAVRWVLLQNRNVLCSTDFDCYTLKLHPNLKIVMQQTPTSVGTWKVASGIVAETMKVIMINTVK